MCVSDNTQPQDELQETPLADEADVESAEQAESVPIADALSEAEARAAEYLDSLQRERAAFQNYKKRVERERAEQARVIAGDLLLKLLPVLDDFYRAVEAIPPGEQPEWVAGIVLILRKLERYLADQDVTPMEALGQPFDPAVHDAIGVDTETDAPSGTVTAVLQRGYMHGDRVLRPALVRAAQ